MPEFLSAGEPAWSWVGQALGSELRWLRVQFPMSKLRAPAQMTVTVGPISDLQVRTGHGYGEWTCTTTDGLPAQGNAGRDSQTRVTFSCQPVGPVLGDLALDLRVGPSVELRYELRDLGGQGEVAAPSGALLTISAE